MIFTSQSTIGTILPNTCLVKEMRPALVIVSLKYHVVGEELLLLFFQIKFINKSDLPMTSLLITSTVMSM